MGLLFVRNQADVRGRENIPKISVKLAQAWGNQWMLDEGKDLLPFVILYNLIKRIILYYYAFCANTE
jgi:hypothetical protein